MGLVACAAIGLTLAGCRDSFDKIEDWEADRDPAVAEDIADVRAPEGFDFRSSSPVSIDFVAVQPGTDIPVAGVGLSILTQDAEGVDVERARGATDESGHWYPQIVVPADLDSLTVNTSHAGYPTQHRVAIASGGRATTYTLGAEVNAAGRIVPEPTLEEEVDPGFVYDDDDNAVSSRGALEGRAAMAYLGGYDAQGVPDYLTTPGTIWPDVLDFISANLPERPGVPVGNPHFLDEENQGSLLFREGGELWISFAHEGAGYRNALGYFTYPIGDPPSSKNQIDVHTVVFPNTSFAGSGGGLAVGDRVYLGTFPANTAVGWFLIPNGWNSSGQVVNDKWNTHYSIDKLNNFTRKKYRKHTVLLANNVREFLVLGFEDLNRPGGDNDFNDAVFVLEPRPWSSVITDFTPEVTMPGDDTDADGVANNVDLYPDDPERAFEVYTPAKGSYGTLAYEDMWPRIGDYDFNDLVVDYSFTEVLNSANQIKDIKLDLRVRALGGSQDHGFAINFPELDPAIVASITGQVLGGDSSFELEANGTERGVSTAVMPVFTSGFDLFGESRGIINTDPAKPQLADGEAALTLTLRTPQFRDGVGYPPYDPFLVRSRDRGREIHLSGYAPTEKADLTAFNTEADGSDLTAGHTYIDANNLPWALDLPASMTYPEEKVRIDAVYPDFTSWATYGGESYESWFRNGGGEGGYTGGR